MPHLRYGRNQILLDTLNSDHGCGQCTVVALRPHSDDATRAAAMAEMAAQQPDLVLLDCISYTRQDKAAAVAALSCPVLLSVAVAARAAASLLPES